VIATAAYDGIQYILNLYIQSDMMEKASYPSHTPIPCIRPVLSLFHKRPSDLSALLNYCFCDKYQAPNTLYLFISIPQEARIKLSGTRRLLLSLLDLLDSFQHDTTCLFVHSLREVSLGLREGVEARRGEVDKRGSGVTRREGTKEGGR
jgi:hypothetical protein